MIYDVRQSTIYHYASPVAVASHVLRLTPIDRPHQRVHAASLEVSPHPVERRERRDFFGNRITTVVLNQPHDTLKVRVMARISVEHDEAADPLATPPWEEVRAAAYASADLSPQSPSHYLFPSRQVSLDPEIRDYAASSFTAGRPVLDGAIDLMNRIKAEFVYEIGATTATTTAPMSFALRRGVCQDFSHIMISGMRSLGLPAAYVSGYLRTAQRPGEARLEGADAMHAWMIAWCGDEAGWIGLDPTNAMLAGNDHIVLAIGRDYADVAPVDGVIVASGGQRIEVSVQVVPVEPASAGTSPAPAG
jgi:transglutaminase-like putative cysteine protease